jgi:hypothetical protein
MLYAALKRRSSTVVPALWLADKQKIPTSRKDARNGHPQILLSPLRGSRIVRSTQNHVVN